MTEGGFPTRLMQEDAATLMAATAAGPAIEETAAGVEVTFAAIADAARVGLWAPATGRPLTSPMRRVASVGSGAQLWAYGTLVPSGTVGSYGFVIPDLRGAQLLRRSGPGKLLLARRLGRRMQADERNPRRLPAVHATIGRDDPAPSAWVSVFDTTGELRPETPTMPGQLTVVHGNRTVSVLDSAPAPAAVVLMLDGELMRWFASDLLTATAQHRLPPARYVFVHNRAAAARGREQLGSAAFRAELRALAEQHAAPLSEGARCFVVGASTAGVAAVLLAAEHPEFIHGAAALSGAFGALRGGIDAALAQAGSHVGPVWLSYGQTESDAAGIPHAVRNTGAALEHRSSRVQLTITPGGHDAAAWRGPLSDALEWLFTRS